MLRRFRASWSGRSRTLAGALGLHQTYVAQVISSWCIHSDLPLMAHDPTVPAVLIADPRTFFAGCRICAGPFVV